MAAPRPRKQLIGGRLRKAAEAPAPHPLGEYEDPLARSLLRQTAQTSAPVAIDPFEGTRHRVFKPRAAKLPRQLTNEELREKFKSTRLDDMERQCSELRQQYTKVAHEINNRNMIEDKEFEMQKYRENRPNRGSNARSYMKDMYSTVSHQQHCVKELPGSEHRVNPRANTDITSWCSNVLNHFWIYENSRGKPMRPPPS
mmetsp:Transcript_23629/g.69140  ORF Transcript_23629/g.69140 Transcript_23629/m.69140 type:complete len:199 (-) Transcript_23629:59-655(-)